MAKPTNVIYPNEVDKGYEIIIFFIKDFVKSFDQIAGKEFNSSRFRNTLPFVRKSIHDLRILFDDLNFNKDLNEVYFFKHVKPLINSYLISELELSRIFLYKPDAEQSDTAYYSSFIEEYQDFFARNNFQYKYYKSMSTEFDYLLFVRQEDISLVTIDYSVLSDPGFSTAFDSVFAKFIAFERIQEILKNLIKYRSIYSSSLLEGIDVTNKALIWTGEAINLVEVAYGIWLTGQINNGEATISEIIHWMEGKFKLKIGRAYRRWTEISRRKLISPTKYLDQMKDSINKRIEDEHDLKSSQRRASRSKGKQ